MTDGLQPETIVDQPVALLNGELSQPQGSASGSSDATSPTIIPNLNFPKIVVAADVISTRLDTATGQIKGNFQFEQMGAIQIGQVLISPTGILGTRASDSATTFSLDATTGDATFLGTIAAGAVISATISANNITAGTLDGNTINVTNLNASNITTGTLNGRPITNTTISGSSTWNGNSIDQAYIGNLDAGKITTGSLSADRIAAGSITASKLSVSTLDAIAANMGTLTSGVITLSNVRMDSNAIQLAGSQALVLVGSINGTIQGYLGYDGSNIDLVAANGKTLVLATSGGGSIFLLNSTVIAASLNMNGNSINSVSEISGNQGHVWFNNGHGDTTEVHHLDPTSGNQYNLGGSSRYWFAINYHFLTKQGGFGVFDNGVEMQDGKILSDTEALLAMQPDKVRKEWGKPIFDFETLPKVIRVYPKTHDGKPVHKNKDGKYIDSMGDEHFEGEDVNAMISILIGAARELTKRVKLLEENKKGI